MNVMVNSKSELLDCMDVKVFCDSLFDSGSKYKAMVAIARKMPRILEYLGYSQKSNTPILTERALPWLEAADFQDEAVLLCDDIINVGTTLLHYSQFIKNNHLGIPEIKVYASRDEKRELRESSKLSEIPMQIQRGFNEHDYWAFETLLPNELLKTGKPYDIDFPIIELELDELDASRSPEEWVGLFGESFPSANNLTTHYQLENNIVSISLLNPIHIESHFTFNNMPDNIIPIHKLRIFISKNDRLLRIVPMLIPPTPIDVIRDGSWIVNSELRSLYRSICNKAIEGAPFKYEPQYNLLIFLLSFEYALLSMNTIINCLSNDPKSISISKLDLEYLFGRKLGVLIERALIAQLQDYDSIENVINDSETHSLPDKPFKKSLVEHVLDKLSHEDNAILDLESIIRSSLEILDEHHRMMNPYKDIAYPDYRRLRNGFTICDLGIISQQMLPNCDIKFEEMSILLDFFVDSGVMVPVVEEINNVYIRTYRQGEAKPIQFAKYLHSILSERQDDYDKPMNVTHFRKILAAIAIYHPKQVPFSQAFGLRGGITSMEMNNEIEKKTEDTLEFLKRKNVIDILTREEWEEKAKHKELPLFPELEDDE